MLQEFDADVFESGKDFTVCCTELNAISIENDVRIVPKLVPKLVPKPLPFL